MARTKEDRILAGLEKERDALAALDSPDRRRRLKQAKTRRDRKIKDAIAAGIPERLICLHGGVTRGWIWKVKKGTN